MITVSKGDVWMGLKYPWKRRYLLGSAGTGVRVKMKERREKEVRTTKSNLSDTSPICSKMGQIGISSSLHIGLKD